MELSQGEEVLRNSHGVGETGRFQKIKMNSFVFFQNFGFFFFIGNVFSTEGLNKGGTWSVMENVSVMMRYIV